MAEKKIYLMSGLVYGDECKGSMVDYFVRKYDADLVVRYNGGPQAAHNVVEPDGRHHCFAQFGSGTFVENVKTYLSEFMLVNPFALEAENEVLISNGITDAMERLYINKDCLMVTPFHITINRMQEIARGSGRHGSCGHGIGQTVLDGEMYGKNALRMSDLCDDNNLKTKLYYLWKIKVDLAQEIASQNSDSEELVTYLQKIENPNYFEDIFNGYLRFKRENHFYLVGSEYFKTLFEQSKNVIFEGAQGLMLDREYGFFPHVTNTRITFENADNILLGIDAQIIKIGISRAFLTRHGAGPFVTEDDALKQLIACDHNAANQWQGQLRVGYLDLILLRFAIEALGGIDSIALTCLDRFTGFEKVKICKSYEYRGKRVDLLDSYFNWERAEDKRIKITGLKSGGGQKLELTELLRDTVPLDFEEFDGWENNSSSTKQVQEFINYLESEEGLNTTISVLSFGPTWQDKIELRPSC